MIRVTYKSEILGYGLFWEGAEDTLDRIRNIPARRLAVEVAKDGKTRELGMWKVEKSQQA